MNAGGRLRVIGLGCLGLAAPPAPASPAVIAQLEAGVWTAVDGGGTRVREYPLTPLGRARYEGFRLDRDPLLRCLPPGMPRGFAARSPMDFSFDGATLTIRYETMDVVRTIHMQGAPPPADAPHSPNGYAVGYWQGDTLVIETSHLSAGQTNRDGIPKSERMTIRTTYDVQPREDGMALRIAMTLTDPAIFTEPVTMIERFEYQPGWELLPFECQVTVY